MVIKTIKWNKKLCVTALAALGVLLIVIVLLARGGDARGPTKSREAFSNEARVLYLSNLGWEVFAEPVETQEIVLPQEFGGVFAEYNKLQKQQGFDLSRFAGDAATLYSYEVTNYPSADMVLANLYVIEGRVVGGDIHSTSLDGFMHALS